MLRKTVIIPAIALVLVAGACGQDNESATDETGETAASSTTTAVAGNPRTDPNAVPDLSKGPNVVTTKGPSGSGCTPTGPALQSLPEGWWAGEIRSVQDAAGTGERSVEFDLGCYFAGDAAVEAATADGQEAVNNAYVRWPEQPMTFTETFASPDVPATCVGDDNQPFKCTANDVLETYKAAADGEVTRDVNGKMVTAFPIVWVHKTGTTPDYLYMQYEGELYQPVAAPGPAPAQPGQGQAPAPGQSTDQGQTTDQGQSTDQGQTTDQGQSTDQGTDADSDADAGDAGDAGSDADADAGTDTDTDTGDATP